MVNWWWGYMGMMMVDDEWIVDINFLTLVMIRYRDRKIGQFWWGKLKINFEGVTVIFEIKAQQLIWCSWWISFSQWLMIFFNHAGVIMLLLAILYLFNLRWLSGWTNITEHLPCADHSLFLQMSFPLRDIFFSAKKRDQTNKHRTRTEYIIHK